jgi:hypothetical protein
MEEGSADLAIALNATSPVKENFGQTPGGMDFGHRQAELYNEWNSAKHQVERHNP